MDQNSEDGSRDLSVSQLSRYLANDKGIVLLPVSLIILAELLSLRGYYYLSIWVHVGIIVGLSFASIYLRKREMTMIFQALMLLSILRLVNVSMPIFFEMTLYTFIFIYATLLIPVFIILNAQGHHLSLRTSDELKKKWPIYSLIAVIMAFAIAQGEYAVIDVGYLIPDLSLSSLLLLSVVMIFFVGFIEEAIFRYILQTDLEYTFGTWQALLIASVLFGVMHSGYGTVHEILMTAGAGLAIGYLYIRTRSLYLITMVHGMTNVFLFGVIPHLGPGLGLI